MKSFVIGLVFALAVPAFGAAHARPLPPGQSPVTKNDRVLLMTIDFVKYGDPKYAWLYKFMNTSGVLLTQQMMSPSYRTTYLLGANNATSTNFVNALGRLTADPATKAVDTFLHLHGSRGGTMWFIDGGASASDLRSAMASQDSAGKLRLFYSTACYGADAAPDMIAAGYRVASGAIAVNADSTWAYPTTMRTWAARQPYSEVVSAANNSFSIWASDKVAQTMGFGSDINSKKLMFGDGQTRIDGITAP